MISWIDIAIVIVYFCLVAVVGFWVAKKASGSLEDFFLAGRKIPRYILGISGMATFIDMSGTMLQTSFFYMLGVKGYWVAYRGAVALVLAFSMIFIAKWLRRSGMMTNAEFLRMRFGPGPQGHIPRALSVFSILAMTIPVVGFTFIGMAKFFEPFIKASNFPISAEYCTLIIFVVVMLYTSLSGFYGVVFTDMVQSALIVGVMVFVIVKAISIGTPEYFQQYAPEGWLTLKPSLEMEMPAGYENMRYFGYLLICWIIMNVMQGFAHPIDASSSQRFFSAKDERESSLVSLQWILMFSLRFALIAGLAVLALQFKDRITDPEKVLPMMINDYFPVGLKGIFIAALIAACTSTLCSYVNAGAAYYVRDVHQAYLFPNASKTHLVRTSSLTTILIMGLGILIGWKFEKINDLWVINMFGLMSGLMVPNILKWFWWRFNGVGFACGTLGGLFAPVVYRLFVGQDVSELNLFWISVGVSAAATIIGTFFGKLANMETLLFFYQRIRPFGFWGPVRAKCEAHMLRATDQENRRDKWLLIPACV